MQTNSLKGAIAKGDTLRTLYGSDAAVIETQKERYTKLVDEFVATYGDKDLTVFSSPVTNRDRRQPHRP